MPSVLGSHSRWTHALYPVSLAVPRKFLGTATDSHRHHYGKPTPSIRRRRGSWRVTPGAGFGLLPGRPVEFSTPKTAGWSSLKARPEDPVRGEPAQVRTDIPGWRTPTAVALCRLCAKGLFVGPGQPFGSATAVARDEVEETMARPDKAAAVAELNGKFTSSAGIVLTEYRGLTVKALKDLRRSTG